MAKKEGGVFTFDSIKGRAGIDMRLGLWAVALAPLLFRPPGMCAKAQSVRQQTEATIAEKEGNADSLLVAVRKGDVSSVKRLLARGASLTETDEEDRDALMLAIISGREDVVKMLLAAGANVNAEAPDTWTPLMFALHLGSAAILNEVIAAGANLNVRYGQGQTPLIAAAVGSSSDQKVKILLADGASPLEVDYNGWTALMVAAEGNEGPGTLRTLIEAGCEVNHVGDEGETALMCAARQGVDPASLRILLDAGADVSMRDSSNKTALDYAREFGRRKLVKILERAVRSCVEWRALGALVSEHEARARAAGR